MRSKAPAYQGKLDGLCGLYAIVNAFEHCGIVDHEKLFQTGAKALSQRRWPAVLWEGLGFGDMQRMVKSCIGLKCALGIVVRYPFCRKPPKSNEEYWKRFDDLFSGGAICGIVGMRQPSYHWIVVRHDAGRLEFTDADPMEPFKRKNKTSVFSGLRRRKSGQWLIDRSELIIFSRDR